jgi:uncharacterized protein (TIGR00369 family)
MMDANQTEAHYRNLESMYLGAPANAYYKPRIHIEQGRADLIFPVRPDLYHAANAVHGASYFKAIDDAAFFAANSLVFDVFLLTASLNCYLVRPIAEGEIRAAGRAVCETRSVILAETVLTDSNGNEIGRGSGSFVRSKILLETVPGYGMGERA